MIEPIEILRFQDRLDEWAVVYENCRVVVILGEMLGEDDGRFSFEAGIESLTLGVIGSTSMGGKVTILKGRPILRDDPDDAAALDATAAGDLSWAYPDPVEPAGREEFSVSVFVPPQVDRAELERVCELEYDDSREEYADDEDTWFTWYRPLADEMIPSSGQNHGDQLAVKAGQWGGFRAWELVANFADNLTRQLIRLVGVHDLALITADDQFYDRDRLLIKIEREGPGWKVGWSRWLFGYEESDEDGAVGEPEPAPRPRPVRSTEPFPPGPKMAGPLDEWAVVYGDDGCVVIINANRVTVRDGIYYFEALTEDGSTVTMGYTPTKGAIALLHGTPRLRDNPEAAAMLEPLNWGESSADQVA